MAIIEQAKALLKSKEQVTYRLLNRRFVLDNESGKGLKEELVETERVADDENGRVSICTGDKTSDEIVTQTAETFARPRI